MIGHATVISHNFRTFLSLIIHRTGDYDIHTAYTFRGEKKEKDTELVDQIK